MSAAWFASCQRRCKACASWRTSIVSNGFLRISTRSVSPNAALISSQLWSEYAEQITTLKFGSVRSSSLVVLTPSQPGGIRTSTNASA